MSSYWHHGGEGGGCQGTDLSNSSGLNGEVRGADRPDINGTYTTFAFAAEAERLIAAHDASRPMYMYLSFEAVHDTGGKANPPYTASLEAPLPQVVRYGARVLKYVRAPSSPAAHNTALPHVRHPPHHAPLSSPCRPAPGRCLLTQLPAIQRHVQSDDRHAWLAR